MTATPARAGIGRWLTATKPPSWPKLLVPYILGQALGVACGGGSTASVIGAGALGLVFTMAGTWFIVLTNDWADRDVDRIKRRMFPHDCSPKTIPDGLLPAHQVLFVGLGAGGLAFVSSVVAALLLGRGMAVVAGGLCMAIFVAYSLPPGRLNYRGGGEAAEAIGVGIALPLYNAYLQAGTLPSVAGAVLGGFTLLSLASAIASGLSDEVSDRAGGKRTITTVFGNRVARRSVEGAVAAGGLWWLVAGVRGDEGHVLGLLAAAAIAGVTVTRLRRRSTRAVTNAFREQAAYKLTLHRGIWLAGLVVATALLVAAVL